MWSHYAESHTGVCFQFSNDDFFGRALRVEYYERYPSLSLLPDGPTVLHAFLTKSHDWSYEDEYRIIAQERGEAVAAETLMTDDGFITFPAESLRTVYLGCRMPEANRQIVKDLIKLSPTKVELRQMNILRDRYALIDEPVPV